MVFRNTTHDENDLVFKFDESVIHNKNLKVDVLRWDVTKLPLRENSIDIFVTDLPFGKRSGSKSNNKLLYKKALQEIARVIKLSTGKAVFLTYDKNTFIRSFQMTKLFWKQTKSITVNMGGLEAVCFVLRRTEKEFENRLSKSERKRIARNYWVQKKKEMEEVIVENYY